MRILFRLERCKDKESKFVRNFECEKLKFLSWRMRDNLSLKDYYQKA